MPSRPRPGLNRAAVVQAAAELLDANGGDGSTSPREVTLGEVAAKLGVRTPSLYNHIGGQEELRHELALLGLRELSVVIGRAAIGKAGDDAVLAIADAYRRFARERPGLYLATQRAPDPDDTEHQAAGAEIIAMLRLVLEPYGLSSDEEVHAIRGLRALVHGFVSLELAGGFRMAVDLEESYHWLLGRFVQGLTARTP